MPSYTLHPIRGNTLIPSIRTSLSLGWNAIVVPERKAKRFTAASTAFTSTPVRHVTLSFHSPPTGEHQDHRGQLMWLIVPAYRLCVWQHSSAAQRNFVRLLRGRIWQPVMGTGSLGTGVGNTRSTRAPGPPSHRNRCRIRRRFLSRLRLCPRPPRRRCARRSRSLMGGVSPTLILNPQTVQGETRARVYAESTHWWRLH